MINSIAGKNLPLSPAATDLGLGDQLVNQMQDEVLQRRKQKLLGGPGTGQGSDSLGLGAAQDLLGRSQGGLGG